ncbi:alpha/beta fold hydrolase [Paludifilum halophilum]|uniref:AB hydrolase-1 domain-containing protein n=1 Tax=Paludifilum halophilum TaxID=1642702 RepID=A0A235B3V7_9BACL|nr:alpha/beta fold hydrolase [Paludifilum halophilum]OYD06911.1 hypothetical protein CHM34_13295 [Paludifilum halophilum]
MGSERRAFLWIPGWGADSGVWSAERRRWNAPGDWHLTVNWTSLDRPESVREIVWKALHRLSGIPVYILGWSMGAMAALEAALSRPEGIRGLYLAGAAPQFRYSRDYPAGWRDRVLVQMRRRLVSDLPKVLAAFDRRMFSRWECVDGWFEQWRREGRPRMMNVGDLSAGLEYLRRFSIVKEVSRLRVPVHLLHGGEDVIAPLQGADLLAERLPEGRLTIWEKAGHLPFWTQPERFHQWLKERIES